LLVWAALLVLGELLPREESSAFGAAGPEFGTLESVGRLIFGPYLLPFEVTSVLLLAAILGAVAIAKRKLR
jgi:NADH-quinone oxidoreductase subunit J